MCVMTVFNTVFCLQFYPLLPHDALCLLSFALLHEAFSGCLFYPRPSSVHASTTIAPAPNAATVMNTRPAIDETTGPVSLSVAFNQDSSCFSVGLDTGFCGTESLNQRARMTNH